MVRLVDAKPWRALTTPRPDGLPNARVLWWFPLLLIVLMAVAVSTGVSGSSTGTWHLLLGQGPDPRLLWGQPRPIRSDEWLAQGSWLVSQFHQGFPAVNRVFPGGMDATVFNDVPTWDWSTAFRPQLWGSLVLDLDRGQSFRWWFQSWMLLSAIHVFVVSVLPRRALLGAALALVAVFQPLVQWWWFPQLTIPMTFAFVAMTALVWALRSRTRAGRLVPAAVAGYLAVTAGMTVYLPFMLACGYPAAAYVLGEVLAARRDPQATWRSLGRRLVPLAVAATGAAVVMALWVLTRRDTIDAVLGTAYPGRRSLPTGSGTPADLVTLFSAPFDRALMLGTWEGLGSNQSTGSAPFMIGLFLLLPLVWLAVHLRHRGLDWPVVCLAGAHLLVLAIMFVPGWDLVARILLADKAPGLRFRLAFVVLAVVAVVLLVERLDRSERAVPWWVVGATGGAAILSTGVVWAWLDGQGSPVVPSRYAVVVALVLAGAVVALARGLALVGTAGLLAATLVVAGGVNPLYRGVFDASADTRAGRLVTSTAKKDPEAAWVGVGTTGASMGLLFEAAVPAYSGVQTYPSHTMWRRIDPDATSETAWNRLGHIHWVAGEGDPDPRQPAKGNADVIEVTFDSCAPFAQEHVTYVLAEGAPLRQRCLQPLASFDDGRLPLAVYRVVKTG